MFKSITLISAMIVATSAYAVDSPITGNVSSKCSIFTDKAGVYGNPTPDELSTLTADGGVLPIIRYDEIGRAHVRTPVTSLSRMPSSA